MRYVVALFLASFLSAGLYAQVNINLNFNLDTQPVWGPAGYDYAEYYYLPDIEVYYNVPQHRYYYYNDGHWIYSSNMPARYNHYDIYNSYKVVLNEKEPWHNHKTYRERYSSYKARHDQKLIRDSKDSKYFKNKNHPEHKNWVMQQKNNSGKNSNGNKGNDGKGKKNKQK